MEELIKYFTDLLILQYRNKPKAKATIEALARQTFSDSVGNIFPIEVQKAYDLDTASGDQLDIIGKYILGVDRYLKFPIDDNFAYADYDESSSSTIGYSEYSSEANTYPYAEYRYTSYNYQRVTDDAFRRILKMCAELKGKPLSLGCIDDALYRNFGSSIYIVEGNKSINYHISSTAYLGLDTQDKLNSFFEKFFPRPMGCSMAVIRD